MQADEAGARLEAVAEGIHRFDTRYIRARHTSSLIVVADGRAAIFDCGVPANVEALVAAVGALGVAPDAVDYLIASHAHLDHMAGLGALARHLPAARIAAHPSAAPHLADPSKLVKGARALFGEAFFDREYGTIEPVPAERIVETADEEVLVLGSRELLLLHTPGHAWHHQSLLDIRSRTVLAADAFGVSYPELVGPDGPFAIPTTAPPQLAPAEMHASIDRLVGLSPRRVLPTHFAPIDRPEPVAEDLHRMLDDWLQLARQADSAEDLRERLGDACAAELERRGRGDEAATMREAYALDLWLNSEGLWYWRQRQEQRASAS
ncbi:MAG: MBL fold metallo-hydrolase [Halofilum sp. (in: g-proteobacteria)]|nr:MBL fold metallo-hydrolase [Halofilum sp. (in: g-proteobacteria)]